MTAKMLLAALALAAPLAAQQPATPDRIHHPMMGASMSDMTESSLMGPVMRMMAFEPQHLLARKDALGLTADQVSHLTALREAAKSARDAAHTEAETHVKELAAVANAPQPDTAALKTHFQAALNAMGKAHWAMLTSAVQARTVLNDAQRTKTQAWADSMEASAEQHRKMMPGHTP
ncbi:MAG TPA: Spy/CpxP family protein refolding chaperone [Gemmatimonadales bacterium]|jgi:Spy/CpxP family protein refolding chaperone|nr:Spy/CpxP family protein refolding chaperone [Gemmatimonadales bacterium]